jgi:hypothetical protein
MTEFVCAWCDVYCRKERGSEWSWHTVCAYCGRSELRFGKLGRQTPIPPPPTPPDDDCPF